MRDQGTNGCPLFIGGNWTSAADADTEPVFNPSDGSVIARTPMCGASEVDAAVRAAREALSDWSATPVVDRARILFRYVHLLEAHFEELSRLVTREHGKTLEEARGSVRRGIEVVEFACGAPTLLMGDALEEIASGIDCDTIRQPVGVCAGITPFNFPAMVPMWMYPIAIVCGNTFVLKPSEKVPLTAVRLVELLQEAGLPPGVMNLVHGGVDVVNALCTHPDIDAVSFVGSSPVARHVYQTATAHGKRVQAAGGAKNYMVILPDADPDFTVDALIGSVYGCAGERCMAGSVAVAVDDAARRVLPPLREALDGMKIGPTDRDSEVDMGPVVTRQHLDKVHGYIASGLSDGASLYRDGRGVEVPETPDGFYLGPTIFDEASTGMKIVREEIFGPVLSVIRTESLDKGIEACNQSGFGNAAVLFTGDGKAARTFRNQVSVGMVGINVGVPAPMAFFPFSGWNGSFFGDLHIQGKEGFAFYTRQKVTMSRWA
ncbi:MAG: CoA-acylating methylmalonate-semialdehyde dehydrogenase [Gemmatimonadetes bacterium]|nr:CoA-acylating methylmalonate-semialdehyde dehydrogenase [Gemmatimonadota bacterium]MYG16371.1 CoA-acylating methylmalonate-semialdehyde dehydrogenase [Gemmatimonadota bacterium]